ncbi:hypothetical protein OIE69_43950 (plasmid) [Actinacidiphila glaucinigra]|uniref:hypothetical protein n=1 Tax=Actinacidiphila glaucinigra TaxID=235986 RepID=UPI002DD8DFF2|nr:hypothetical protein [Actinacidiphila glaucinigra]WSD65859.1 hypothetical protein OIE69_43950 [Actinacidiphila glaucinigra]
MTVIQLRPPQPPEQPEYIQGAPEDPSPIAALCRSVRTVDLAERARERDEAAAFNAVLTAGAVLVGSFPDTLAAVVPNLSWSGFVPLPEQGLPASAVAFLGAADAVAGWWLHYSADDSGRGERHVLTLVVPCSCGTYFEQNVDDEDALGNMLAELHSEPGAPVDCDARLLIRSTSRDNPHDSTVTPQLKATPTP